MGTTSDVRDLLSKQLYALAGLRDLDPANEKDRAEIQHAIEVAKASAIVAGQYTQLVRAEIDAARTMAEFNVITAAVETTDLRRIGASK